MKPLAFWEIALGWFACMIVTEIFLVPTLPWALGWVVKGLLSAGACLWVARGSRCPATCSVIGDLGAEAGSTRCTLPRDHAGDLHQGVRRVTQIVTWTSEERVRG